MNRRPYFTSALASLAGILILASGCMDQSPTATVLDPAVVSGEQAQLPTNARPMASATPFAAGTFSSTITPAGGTIDFGIGSIDFPKGAVQRATVITASVDGKSMLVEFEPHGLTFAAGHEPTLTFNSSGIDLKNGAVIYYIDSNGNVLEDLGGWIDTAAETVSAALKHFSPYILAAG